VRDLIALCLPGGPRFVDELRRAWDDGDAVLPLDPRLPTPALASLLDALRPSAVIDEHGTRRIRAGGEPVEDGDALVVATSGSTGHPKGVVHTHGSVAASARATNAGIGTDPSTDRFLCCMPLNHVAGLSVVTRALHSGTPVEVLPTFDATEVERAATERGATITTMVPTALLRIDPSLYRRIVVGGAAPPADLPPNVLVSYGLTETGSAIAYDGLALEGAELRIVDGLVEVRGPMLFRAYRDGRDPKDADGWFATNDAGELDDEGRVRILGRRDDLIITGGENVWPTAVEWALHDHSGVADVAVIGRPDPEWGRCVTALVVPTDPAVPPTLDELRDWVKERLPAYAAPRRLDVVEALPRTLLGKIRRTEV
jgi:O-succinylbenzoic acid--CoA ligase